MTSALRWGWVLSTTPRPLYSRERPGTHCTGAWVGPRAGLNGCGKSRPPPGFDSSVRPARSESLYRLSYPGRWSDTIAFKTTRWSNHNIGTIMYNHFNQHTSLVSVNTIRMITVVAIVKKLPGLRNICLPEFQIKTGINV